MLVFSTFRLDHHGPMDGPTKRLTDGQSLLQNCVSGGRIRGYQVRAQVCRGSGKIGRPGIWAGAVMQELSVNEKKQRDQQTKRWTDQHRGLSSRVHWTKISWCLLTDRRTDSGRCSGGRPNSPSTNIDKKKSIVFIKYCLS